MVKLNKVHLYKERRSEVVGNGRLSRGRVEADYVMLMLSSKRVVPFVHSGLIFELLHSHLDCDKPTVFTRLQHRPSQSRSSLTVESLEASRLSFGSLGIALSPREAPRARKIRMPRRPRSPTSSQTRQRRDQNSENTLTSSWRPSLRAVACRAASCRWILRIPTLTRPRTLMAMEAGCASVQPPHPTADEPMAARAKQLRLLLNKDLHPARKSRRM